MHPLKILFVVLTGLVCPSLRAADAPRGISVIGDLTFASEYVFRGVERAAQSFQPSVEVGYGSFVAGLWTNQPVSRSEHDEVNLYASYRWVTGTLELEGIGTYYWYPEAKESLGEVRQSQEIGIGARWQIGRLSPGVSISRDFAVRSESVRGGLTYLLPFDGFGRSNVEVGVFGGAVDADKPMPGATGAAQGEAYSYFGADFRVLRRLSEAAALSIGAHHATSRDLGDTRTPSGGRARENLWFTVGVTLGI
jgi:hypothetical protein